MLHVLPVFHDAMLHGLSDLEEVAVLGGLITDHDILDNGGPDALFCTQYGSSNDGGEY